MSSRSSLAKKNVTVKKAKKRNLPPHGKTQAQPSKLQPQPQASNRDDKEKVVEHNKSEEETECENQITSMPKENDKENTSKPTKPTYAQLLKRFMLIKFTPTRYPDPVLFTL